MQKPQPLHLSTIKQTLPLAFGLTEQSAFIKGFASVFRLARFKYRNLRFNAIIFYMVITLVLLISLFNPTVSADDLKVMPNTCDELLPDVAPYIELFDQTAQLWVMESSQKAKKMFDVLALRTMYQETTRDYNNPIDWLIRDSVCECSSKNKGELFTSASRNLKKCLAGNLDKFIKKAEKEYVKLRLDNYKKDQILKTTEAQRARIKNLKELAAQEMRARTNAEFNRKTRR